MAGNGFKLSTAEFKGRVIESLDNIKEDIRDIKTKNYEQHTEIFKRLRKIETKPSLSLRPIAWALSLLGFK